MSLLKELQKIPIPFLDHLRRRELIGMDIGASGVKFLKIGPKGERMRSLESWEYNGPVFENQEREVPLLREFVRRNRLAGKRVACNIEDGSLKIRRIDLPRMPDYDLREAVRWQLRDVVEGPVQDYAVRYSLIEEYSSGETKRFSLVAYAIKKAVINAHLEFLKKLSLDPVVIEPTSVSLLAAFDRLHGWQKGEFYGLVDFGESKSVFTAMGEGKLFFSRPLIGVSGRELQKILQKELALGDDETDSLKDHLMTRQRMEGNLSALQDKAESLLPVLYTQMSVEIQRSIDAFFLMFHKERVHRLFLCGGGALLPGLTGTLSKNLGVPAHILDPSVKFGVSVKLPHLCNVALGLALSQL